MKDIRSYELSLIFEADYQTEKVMTIGNDGRLHTAVVLGELKNMTPTFIQNNYLDSKKNYYMLAIGNTWVVRPTTLIWNKQVVDYYLGKTSYARGFNLINASIFPNYVEKTTEDNDNLLSIVNYSSYVRFLDKNTNLFWLTRVEANYKIQGRCSESNKREIYDKFIQEAVQVLMYAEASPTYVTGVPELIFQIDEYQQLSPHLIYDVNEQGSEILRIRS